MAPAKRKNTNQTTVKAEISSLHTVVVQAVVLPEQTLAQTTGAGMQVQGQRPTQEKNKTALINQDTELVEDEDIQPEQEDEYTQTALKLKAIEKEKSQPQCPAGNKATGSNIGKKASRGQTQACQDAI